MIPATVIVGASIGGVRTAQALRSGGYEGHITLVGDETVLPYDRPPLSKDFLNGTATADSVTLFTEQDARDLGIQLMLGRAARYLDVDGGFVELEDGERLRYDDVVVATGSRPQPSPWGKPAGVHYLRTLADATGLREDLRRGGPLLVIGAGFIGAEVAATARQLGVAEVTLIDPAPVPMSRVIDAATAARLGGMHREHGVATRFGAQVEAIEQVTGGLVVRLADGAVMPAATVVVGIGAVPNDEWLASSRLLTGGGLRCDERCRAYGAPRVHAVGDVARWHHPGHGTLVRAEHWTNAVEQAGYVAEDITRPGGQAPYQPVDFVWSDQYDAKIQITGRTGAGLPQVAVERPESPGSFAVLYGTGTDALAGAITVSWPRAAIAARRAITAGTSLDQAHATITAPPGRPGSRPDRPRHAPLREAGADVGPGAARDYPLPGPVRLLTGGRPRPRWHPRRLEAVGVHDRPGEVAGGFLRYVVANLEHPVVVLPGELAAVRRPVPADQRASLALAAELADLGARIHAHPFMPLPGTPLRDAAPASIPVATLTELDRLAQQGASYEAAAESDLLANAVSAAFLS